MRTHIKNGSPEHFRQVVDAHVLSPWSGTCRCGMTGPLLTDVDYRAHIAKVWRPYDLPEGWFDDEN